MITLPQHIAQRLASLRSEYPDADASDLRDIATGSDSQMEWVRSTSRELVSGTVPTRKQLSAIVRDLGDSYIARHIMRHLPDAGRAWLDAGLIPLPTPMRGKCRASCVVYI
jgi:hypothetical protein